MSRTTVSDPLVFVVFDVAKVCRMHRVGSEAGTVGRLGRSR